MKWSGQASSVLSVILLLLVITATGCDGAGSASKQDPIVLQARASTPAPSSPADTEPDASVATPPEGTHDNDDGTTVAVSDDGQSDGWSGDVGDPRSPAIAVTVNSDETISTSFSEMTASPDELITTYVVPAITDDRILPGASIPASRISNRISLTASPGEYEPASFVIQANDDISDLQVEVADLASGARLISSESVDIRVVKCWYQAGVQIHQANDRVLVPELLLKDDSLVKVEGGENYLKVNGEYVWISGPDGIPGVPDSPTSDEFPVRDSTTLKPVTILANTNTQFWVTVHVPEDASSGRYTGTISLKRQSVLLDRLQLDLEVLPIDLVAPSLTYSIYYRGILAGNTYPDGSITDWWKNETQYRAEMQNMINHGISNPTSHQPYSASSLREVLEIRGEMGLGNQPLYYLGLHPWGDQPIEQVTEIVEIAGDYGVTDVYFYGVDEAKCDELAQQRDHWQAIREAGGKIFVAGYPADMTQCGEGSFELMGDIQDLLASSGRPIAEEAAKWHSAGHKIFSYSNPQSGEENPETYRRNFGLLLWQNDYDGAMDYPYQCGRRPIWNDFCHEVREPGRGRPHVFAYPTVNGVIDTIQWEGFREGVDDVRYLATLVEAIEDAKASSRDTSEPERFIAGLKKSDLQKEDLDSIRNGIIGHILALQAEVDSSDIRPPVIFDVLRSPVSRSSDAGYSVSIGWQTDERATGYVEYGKTRTLGETTLLHQPLMTAHVAFLRDIDPNSLYYYRVVSNDSSGNRANSDVYTLKTNTGLTVSAIALGTSTGDTSDKATQIGEGISLESNFENGAFVDFDRSLLCWLRFDEEEKLTDHSTYSNSIVYDNTSFTNSGRFNGARVFDGEDDHIQLLDSSILQPNGAITIELWMYPRSLDGIGNMVGMKAKSGVNKGVILRQNDDKLQLLIGDGTGMVSLISSPVFNEDRWYHVVGRWDGDEASIWVNGMKLAAIDDHKQPIQYEPTRNVMIGSWEGWEGTFFKGAMDELRIWNRAVTPEEIEMAHDAHQSDGLTFDLPDLPAGAHVYRVYAVDVAGNAVETEPRTIHVEEGQDVEFVINVNMPSSD